MAWEWIQVTALSAIKANGVVGALPTGVQFKVGSADIQPSVSAQHPKNF
jgi:hypothetical protein